MIGLLSKEKVEFALSQLLKAEVNETVTNCNGLKMLAADGKMRITDVAYA
jgi:hypothetical protein